MSMSEKELPEAAGVTVGLSGAEAPVAAGAESLLILLFFGMFWATENFTNRR